MSFLRPSPSWLLLPHQLLILDESPFPKQRRTFLANCVENTLFYKFALLPIPKRINSLKENSTLHETVHSRSGSTFFRFRRFAVVSLPAVLLNKDFRELKQTQRRGQREQHLEMEVRVSAITLNYSRPLSLQNVFQLSWTKIGTSASTVRKQN